MSSIKHVFTTGAPPAVDVYTTRRNEGRDHSLRYWDGALWWDISWSGTGARGGSVPFVWPKKSRSRRPSWAVQSNAAMGLRRISPALQAVVQWGTPIKVFDDRETLGYLVNKGVLPADWRTAFQSEMRAAPAAK